MRYLSRAEILLSRLKSAHLIRVDKGRRKPNQYLIEQLTSQIYEMIIIQKARQFYDEVLSYIRACLR